jgi:hypothetical protein
MFNHIGSEVTIFNRSKLSMNRRFSRSHSFVLLKEATAEQTGAGAHAGFGAGAKPFFWIDDGGCPAGPVHIAFAAALRVEVDA